MSDESVPENKPAADIFSQPAIASTLKILENTEVVSGGNRLIVDAGLLGVCIVFLAAMLGVQKLDGALTTALVFFAIAIPMLVYGFFYGSHKAKPVSGWLLLVALQAGAWIIEGFGGLAVAVGVFAVIAHLSPLAFKALIITSISVVVVGFAGTVIGFMIYHWHKFRKEQQQKPASGETPAQSKGTTEETPGNS